MASSKAGKKQAKSQAEPFPAGNYTPHRLASLVPGEMSKEEYVALCTSIKEDGLQNPIIIFENQVLDGRHRYQACVELGIEPVFTLFKGDVQQATALALANALHRRTLNSMQKAMVAARMHLNPDVAMSQKDAAARAGVGVATVNLAVRLLNSKNTPLIKRCENGEATRAEIDEILFDRAASQAAEPVVPIAQPSDEEEEDGIETPGNVVSIDTARKNIGTKPTHPERRAKETPASHAVAAFKALSEKDRLGFVMMAWVWLRPAVEAAHKAWQSQGETSKLLPDHTPPAAKPKAKPAPAATKAKPKAK